MIYLFNILNGHHKKTFHRITHIKCGSSLFCLVCEAVERPLILACILVCTLAFTGHANTGSSHGSGGALVCDA